MNHSSHDLAFFSSHDELIAAAKQYFPGWEPVREPDADGDHLLFMSEDGDTLSANEMTEDIKKLGGLKRKPKPAPVKWKKGMKVRIAVFIAGITTYENDVVAKVLKKGIYLEGGNGPYDAKTGRHILIDEMGMGSQTITPKKA